MLPDAANCRVVVHAAQAAGNGLGGGGGVTTLKEYHATARRKFHQPSGLRLDPYLQVAPGKAGKRLRLDSPY